MESLGHTEFIDDKTANVTNISVQWPLCSFQWPLQAYPYMESPGKYFLFMLKYLWHYFINCILVHADDKITYLSVIFI